MSSNPQAINVQSYIRVRPLKQKEKRTSHLEFLSKEITIKSENGRNDKCLTFDKVFDENTKQETVYNTVVRPMIKEVLQGYNCTVFAYGQTGTGKTYTMTGEQTIPGQENVHAGIIPRVMEDIFNELEASNCKYQVSVIYIELYNEKLRNLLDCQNTVEDSIMESNIQMLDDKDGGVILKGLVPIPVKSRDEAFKILCEGAEKRQSASTCMNLNSSRSHTIFTINVNIKEMAIDDREDVMRIGKLHLVDLAGSENASKSGASDMANRNAFGVNRRLTEASNINRSLLTLGRVITGITENNPHIPYRESKLTRILRDSLGGRTKTCIIGTISPAQSNLDETESTLNYAYKARSIKNKPEKNRNISDKEFMQVVDGKISHLKHELESLRQAEGFYISTETSEEMVSRLQELEKCLKNSEEDYNRLNTGYLEKQETFKQLITNYDSKCLEYDNLKKSFNNEMKSYKGELDRLSKEIVVREYFIKEYKKTEASLTKQEKACNSVIGTLLKHQNKLHDKVQRKVTVDNSNLQELLQLKAEIATKLEELSNNLMSFYKLEEEFKTNATDNANSLLGAITEHLQMGFKDVGEFMERIKELNNSTLNAGEKLVAVLNGEVQSCGAANAKHLLNMKILQDGIVQDGCSAMKNMCSKIDDFKRFGAYAKKIVKESYGNIQEVEAEVVHNALKLDSAIKDIMELVNTFREKCCAIIVEASQVETKATLAAEKARQIVEAVEELDILTDDIEKEAETVGVTLAGYSENIGDSKTFISNDIVECLTQIGSTTQKTFKSRETDEDFEERIPEEVEYLVSDVNRLLDNLFSNNSKFDVNFKSTREIKTDVGRKIQIVYDACQAYSDDNAHKIKNFQKYEECFYNRFKKRQLEFEQCSERGLRDMYNEYYNHTDALKKEEFKITKAFSNIVKEAKVFEYKPDVSLGVTPQRVPLDQLKFPRQFTSTAPKEVLTQRFLQSESLASVPDQAKLDEIESKEPAEMSQTTDELPGVLRLSLSFHDLTGIEIFPPLPQENVNEESLSKQSAGTSPTVGMAGARRLSLSMPDMSNSDILLSPGKDKENVVILSCGKEPKFKKGKAIQPNIKQKNTTNRSFKGLKESNSNSIVH